MGSLNCSKIKRLKIQNRKRNKIMLNSNKSDRRSLQLRPLGNTGEMVTLAGFGALEIGRNWGIGDKSSTLRPPSHIAESVLNYVLDVGITLIDTASAYHESERRIGIAISHRRNEFFIASKCGEHNDYPNTYYDFSYDAVKKSIDRSLELMKIDTIDLMQIHFGPDAQKTIDEGQVIRAMLDAQKDNKIRFLGASAWGDIAGQCIDMNIFDVMQLEYSLLNRSDENLIKKCTNKNIGVLVRGGLARGMLTPKYHTFNQYIDEQHKLKIEGLLKIVDYDAEKLLALALHFLARNQGVSSILIGAKRIEHIDMCLDLLDADMDDDLVEEASSITAKN